MALTSFSWNINPNSLQLNTAKNIRVTYTLNASNNMNLTIVFTSTSLTLTGITTFSHTIGTAAISFTQNLAIVGRNMGIHNLDITIKDNFGTILISQSLPITVGININSFMTSQAISSKSKAYLAIKALGYNYDKTTKLWN